MKRTALLVAAAAALALGGLAAAAGVVVTLGPTGPTPQTVSVQWGETVTFSNGDSVPYVVELPRATVTSPEIAPGGTWEAAMTGRGGNQPFRMSGGGLDRPRSGVVAVDAEGSVTLEANSETIPAGRSVSLSGVSSFAGRPVTIETRQPADEAWRAVTEVVAADDGSFSVTLRPEPGARYRAQTAGGGVVSRAVVVEIEPRLTLRASRRAVSAGTRVTLVARVRPSAAARRVDFERFDTRRKRWTSMGRTPVRDGVARFAFRPDAGTTRVRAAVRQFLVAPGFAAGTSAVVKLRAR